jgi:polysaccharide deacetylase 2 family uncharacterized protein YibQ
MKKYVLIGLSLLMLLGFSVSKASNPDNNKINVQVTKAERNGKEVIIHFKIKNQGDPVDISERDQKDGHYIIDMKGKKYYPMKVSLDNQKSSRLVAKRSTMLEKNKEMSGKAIYHIPEDINNFKTVRISSKDKYAAEFKNIKTDKAAPPKRKPNARSSSLIKSN